MIYVRYLGQAAYAFGSALAFYLPMKMEACTRNPNTLPRFYSIYADCELMFGIAYE
jgi:hypothetical protein